MIEKFRDVKFKGMINTKYVDGTGNKKIWSISNQDLLNKIQAILREYADQNITLTNRQLYYQLVAGDIIPNAQEIYKRICTFLTDGRYAGALDWSAIEDRGRTPEKHAEWDDVAGLVDSAVRSFRLPRWSDQNFYVELFCEKEALGSVLKPISDKYHIYYSSNKGYSSASTMYDLAQRLKEQIKLGKSCKLLYAGDHDSSGIDMLRDIRDRILEFLTEGEEYVNPDFEVVPIALTMAQIKQYNPPSNPAKITDPRAKGYIAKYGNVSWELDALKPQVLMAIAESNIQKFLDVDKYNAWIQKEKEDIQKLKDFADKVTPPKVEKQIYYAMDNPLTKTLILSHIEHTYEYEDKETADHFGFDVGSMDYFCPICDNHCENGKNKHEALDVLWREHIMEHSQDEFDEWYLKYFDKENKKPLEKKKKGR